MEMEMDQSMAIDRRPAALGDLAVLPDETICSVLDLLSPTDLARLSSVSSVMYIFCNEEPLWMNKCLSTGGPLEYKGSWKKTTLIRQNLCADKNETSNKPLHFDGFFSLFLYKRWYRCHTSLSSFSLDSDDLERKKDISLNDFSLNYDGKNPILIADLEETWPARNKWTFEQLVLNYGDIMFRISQRSPKKILMKLKDYVSYMQVQHDEEPLYIFDDKFGEAAPDLLKDYTVPELFKEDYFEILNHEERPPFRWLIIGPERSGASWHVDPGLTSAWNTLLSGQKRWALYPPGRVPAGVTVHVNEEDGDVSIEGPTSLQWWLEIYPQLSEETKPIELTQRAGETLFVPSGWWHCVLNLESTIAVTQNYVNESNFEFVCLDLAPGHRHKGVARAGLLAVGTNPNFGENPSFDGIVGTNPNYDDIDMVLNNDDDLVRSEKRQKCPSEIGEIVPPNPNFDEIDTVLNNGDLTRKEKRQKCPSEISDGIGYEGFKYDVDYLAKFLERERDHYWSAWSPNIYIGQREMRGWLQKLWINKPQIRDLIWKGACLAINVEKWYKYVLEICASHNLPVPTIDEKLPVGTGSNPVFIVSDNVVKIFVEGRFESSLHCLGTELEFYEILRNSNSALKLHVPEIIASGFVILQNDFVKTIVWNGKGIPDEISELYGGAIGGISDELIGGISDDYFSFGVWKKMQFLLRESSFEGKMIFPYLVTKKCQGDIFAHIRDKMSKDDVMNLSSFLGAQLRLLHELPLPYLNNNIINVHKNPQESEILRDFEIPQEWEFFVTYLHERKKNAKTRLEQWGDPIPMALIEKVEEYLPKSPMFLLDLIKVENNNKLTVSNSPSWIHSDVMDDNILMQPLNNNSTVNDSTQWIPSHLIDFSDLSIGDRLLDIIPLYLDVFRGEKSLLKKFLENYALPFSNLKNHNIPQDPKFSRISYRAMCYCILHDENVLGAIFSLWKELKSAVNWEIVEFSVWGELNDYQVSLSKNPF
ncbi:hypothetical protein LUZ60_006780 [Juncus effusus]|nr:hypothetical protein LUZ60_006780 [Juncus effusus]